MGPSNLASALIDHAVAPARRPSLPRLSTTHKKVENRLCVRTTFVVRRVTMPELHARLVRTPAHLRAIALLGLAHEGALAPYGRRSGVSAADHCLLPTSLDQPELLTIRARVKICPALQPSLFDSLAGLPASETKTALIALANTAAMWRSGRAVSCGASAGAARVAAASSSTSTVASTVAQADAESAVDLTRTATFGSAQIESGPLDGGYDLKSWLDAGVAV